MFKRVIKSLALQSPTISVVSIAITLLGLTAALYYAPTIVKSFAERPFESGRQFPIIGLAIVILIAGRSFFDDLWNIIDTGQTIEVGTSIKDSEYDFWKIFDSRCSEIFIVGQNLRTLLSDPKVLPYLAELLHQNQNLKVTFILTVPKIMRLLDDMGRKEHVQTVEELAGFYFGLKSGVQNRVKIRFHPGAMSLSAFIRDPSKRGRGLIVFVPKWASDREPGNRIYCAVRKWENSEIFKKLFSHISIMTGQRSLGLIEVAKELGVELPQMHVNLPQA